MELGSGNNGFDSDRKTFDVFFRFLIVFWTQLMRALGGMKQLTRIFGNKIKSNTRNSKREVCLAIVGLGC